jgi:hypothetical protein
MERLTERLGDYNNPKGIYAVWVKNHDYVSAAHRLADYEDIADTVGGFDRLRELVKAGKDGRLVVLPCKVGDTVYRLFAGNPDNPVIATLKINTVAEAVKLIGKMGMHKYIGTFLTREEAEKALEAMKDE